MPTVPITDDRYGAGDAMPVAPDLSKHAEPNTLFVGVDPGASGGLACISSSGAEYADAMPTTERDTWDWFNNLDLDGQIHRPAKVVAAIEKVHAMPGNGVSGMFKFGQSYGFLRACLTAARIEWQEVTPQAWQKALAIPKRGKTETPSQWKNRLRARAQQVFPSLPKITLATADALLLAHYCRLKQEGKL